MLTRKAVKWHIKNMFPHPVTEMLLGLMVLATWYSLQDAKRMGFYEFEVIAETVFLPVYGILVASHVFKGQRVTLFELTLFNGPGGVFVGRLVSAIAGLLVGILSVAITVYVQGHPLLMASVLLKLPTYLAIMMVLMVWMDSLGAIISFYILTSAVPMALFVILTKPYPPGTAVSLLAYFLSPIGATVETGKLPIPVLDGYTVTISLSTVMILLSYLGFKMKDFNSQ